MLTTSGPRPRAGSRAGIRARSISVRGPRGLAQSTGTDNFAHSSPSPHPHHPTWTGAGTPGTEAETAAGTPGTEAQTAAASTAAARITR
ncbi:hypothetical protein ACFQQB_48240 [Nonomuraea rubra]|uniref:hypothetical protein n=1 Tax=Nonomuraea rubra TaxID=46180 RepID=UPI00361B2473